MPVELALSCGQESLARQGKLGVSRTCRIEYVVSLTFAISLRSGQFGLGQSPQDKSPVPAAYQNEAETEDIEQ